MQEAKNTQRALVRIGYDGRVHKLFRGPKAKERYENEIRVLRHLEDRDCPFVPRVLSCDDETLEVVMTNCGGRVSQISEEKVKSTFDELNQYGVRHDDPFDRNITYRSTDGRFCVIDFEFATLIDQESGKEAGLVQTSQPEVEPKVHRPEVITWSARSHRGRFRKNNEDYYLAAKIQKVGLQFLGTQGNALIDQNEWIFAVSDGMGGEKSGEFASRITAQRAASILPLHFGSGLSPRRTFSQAILRKLIEDVHQDLLKLGKYDANLRNMGATLTLIWIRGHVVFYGHIGDSRLYHLKTNGEFKQLTEDHSHVGHLYRKGELNEREFRNHARRGVLNQCLGSGHQFLNPQTGWLDVESGDKLLMCTDGVVDGHFDRGLVEMLTSPPSSWSSKSPADRIVQSAVENSGRDNASSVVVEFA